MIKIIFAFLAIFVGIFVGIQTFIATTGREKLDIAKVLSYSVSCAILAILVVATIVILL